MALAAREKAGAALDEAEEALREVLRVAEEEAYELDYGLAEEILEEATKEVGSRLTLKPRP